MRVRSMLLASGTQIGHATAVLVVKRVCSHWFLFSDLFLIIGSSVNHFTNHTVFYVPRSQFLLFGVL